MSSILNGNKYSPEGSRVPTDLLPKAIRYEQLGQSYLKTRATSSAPMIACAQSCTTNVEPWKSASQTQGQPSSDLRATYLDRSH